MSSAQWKESKNKCGVKVSLKEVIGSPIKAFLVEGVVKATPEKVVKALMDFSSFTKWHYGVIESKELKKISENKSLAYMKLDFPWPVKNRDSIATSEIVKVGNNTKIIIERFPDNKMKTKNIRVSKTDGFWLVKSHKEGSYVSQELHAEPGGSIPDWVVNMLLSKSPYQTFKGLREYLGKEGCI
jgi:hypothetical protein